MDERDGASSVPSIGYVEQGDGGNPKVLLIVEKVGKEDSFPGSNLFWSLAASVGLSKADCGICELGYPLPIPVGMDRPEVCVLLGGEVLRYILGISGGVDSLRGYVFTPADIRPAKTRKKTIVGAYRAARKGHHEAGDPKFGWVNVEERAVLPASIRWIIPLLSPESVQLSGLRTIPALKADLSRVVRAIQPTFTPLHVSFFRFPIGLGTLDNGFALDIETVGEAISRIGLSNGGTTWTSSWDFRSRNILQRSLVDSSGPVVGHNLAFDLRFLKRDGVPVSGPFFDTMLAAHLIQPDLYKGLEKVASLYLDVSPWKHRNESDPELYNATDVKLTWEIARRQREVLEKIGMLDLFEKTIMPALPVLIGMTERGIRVSEERQKAFINDLISSQHTALSDLSSKVPGINPLSPPQLRKLLYKELKIPPQKTWQGSETVDEAALKQIRQNHPEHRELLDLILKVRKIVKLRGTYAEVELGEDGCVHPGYLPSGKESDTGAAATGRLASSNPNIQNQPPEARNLFIPHFPGWLFLEADYSQIELRIAAVLSNDSALLKALEGDVHAQTQQLLGCDRVRAKNVLFGSLYGAGPRKLNRILQVHGISSSEAECRALQDRLATAYPSLWAWRTEVSVLGKSQRYLTNPFGRRRYFYGGSSAVPQMIDYLPQSTAADIMWEMFVPLDEFCEANGGHLVTTVHDSFLMEFPRERIDRWLLGSLHKILEREFPKVGTGLRVPAAMKIGSSWGQMEPLPPELVSIT